MNEDEQLECYAHDPAQPDMQLETTTVEQSGILPMAQEEESNPEKGDSLPPAGKTDVVPADNAMTDVLFNPMAPTEEMVERAQAVLSGRRRDKEQSNKSEGNMMDERKEMPVAAEEVQMDTVPENTTEEEPGVEQTKRAVESQTVEIGEKPTEDAEPSAEKETPPSGSDGQEAESADTTTESEHEVVISESPYWVETAKRLEGLEGRLDSADASLKGLGKALQDEVRTLDSVYQEMKKTRKENMRRQEQELFDEIIRLHDMAEDALARVRKDPAEAVALLEGLLGMIDGDILENRYVVKREATPGEKFDGRRHRVWGSRLETGDISLDGCVAETAKAGFDDTAELYADTRDGCKRLRPICVRLWKYHPEAVATPDAESNPL